MTGDPLPPEARAANLQLWNAWARAHERAPGYDVEGFKAGTRTLTRVELDQLGPLLGEGTRLLHLQCHFGLDTLCCARLGARVVGLDFSDEAIALARRLADEVGLGDRASFVLSDLYEADAHLEGRPFEVVFVNWGAIEWLPDLERWATTVARHLEPGGALVMAEIHPFAYSLDEVPGEHDVRVVYRLLPDPGKPDVDPVEGTYADPEARFDGLVAYGWHHSFSELIGALAAEGLRLESLREYPFAPAPFWPWMEEDEERMFWLPDGRGGRRDDLPFSFTLRATKPER
jgi:2-polyprenyl-3-methyl-5-hydroxy-6-metoxy-1,4-benzoquinol methylase